LCITARMSRRRKLWVRVRTPERSPAWLNLIRFCPVSGPAVPSARLINRFCRAFGFGHRKPARLAFERAHVFCEGAPDHLQGHRSAANRAADFITGCEILAHCLLMHAMADADLDVDQPAVDCWRKASAALFTQSPTPGSLCLSATTWHRTLQRSQAEAARRAISTHMPELSLAHDPWPIAWLSGECNLEDSSVRLAPRLSAAMLFAAQVHLCCEGTLRVPPLLPLPLPGYPACAS